MATLERATLAWEEDVAVAPVGPREDDWGHVVFFRISDLQELLAASEGQGMHDQPTLTDLRRDETIPALHSPARE